MTPYWLPVAKDFRAELRSASRLADESQRLEALGRLSSHRLDVLQTIQLNNLIGNVDALPSGWTRVRLALLASATVQHLLPGIRVAGLRRRMLIDTYAGSYGQYRQELANPASGLHAFSPQVVLFALTPSEVLRSTSIAASGESPDAVITAFTEDLRALWKHARDAFGSTVIQQSFLDVSDPLFGHYDAFVDHAPARIVKRLNDAVGAAVQGDGVLYLDIARLAARDGMQNWFDMSHWYASKLQIAPQAADMYGEHLARILAAHAGKSSKCLVLDLDNTLWGGVIGDDGLQGIVLGQGSALGEAHLAVQQYAKQLRERGIILAVCSKNERATAEEVFMSHPEMALRLPDIAAFVANWEDKAENLKSIAAQLNIGLDSLVFVDDNPAERERVRGALPQVSVPELPEDPGGYVRCIADAGYFEAISFTSDDRTRADQYAGNAQRDALRSRAQSMDDFLRDLDMTLTYGPFVPLDMGRVSQLINKTNQFNACGRRYSQQDVEAVAANGSFLTFQFRLSDRFGDNGIISVLIARDAGDGTLELDTWVMSCRVFGRQVEAAIMNLVVDAARQRGLRQLGIDYVPTARNGLLREIFGNLGFAEQSADPSRAGTMRWVLEASAYPEPGTFIKSETASHD